MNHWMRQALPGFGESVALEMLGFLGPDAREGLAAIRERREPQFPSAPPP
jgi:enoyl-CoA hydratase